MRTMLAFCLLLAAAGSARAHFIWLVPEGDKGSALMVFSDALEPDASVPIKKIAHTRLFARGGLKGAPIDFKRDETKDAFRVSVPKTQDDVAMIGGTCEYGVITKGKGEPFLLMYYPKVFLRGTQKEMPVWLFEGTKQLPLEIVASKKKGTACVLWQGKPIADVEVVLIVPGVKEAVQRKTNEEGLFKLDEAKADGVYGIRAAHVEARAGELGDKKYKEVRHYATVTFVHQAKKEAPAKANHDGGLTSFAAGDKLAEDPAATKLLADARAARAVWKNFPGFTADVSVNHEGAIHKGTVAVSAQGKVALKIDAGEELTAWTRGEIVSLVRHRLPGPESQKTPCAFADAKDQHHPLGRAVRVLNDELHSSYRIRDNQIIEVNRATKEDRFTITMLQSKLNAEKQYLSLSYVVDFWDPKSGQLHRSVAEHVTWQRVGAFDMPASILIVKTTSAGRESRSITFGNIQLAKASAGTP